MIVPDNRDAISFLAYEMTLMDTGFPSSERRKYYSDLITKAIKERGILIDGELVFIDRERKVS